MNLATETAFTGEDAVAARPPLTPAELAPHFPQFEILECLGRGGMGVVYKARQKSLNRVVALKLLAPERVADATFAQRFTREAQALAQLNHPHIVTVHDFGQAGGFYFLLMEFVDGVNLRQLLRSRKLTPEEALVVVPPLCEALQYAHDQGIVHRDIKPENLLLDRQGRVKIADFGIAKMLEDDARPAALQETQPAGTPHYMAPEQMTSPQSADHRADIFSLGVVVYEMLTGELPGAKLRPPSRKVQIDVRLDAIVLRALERTPELRYQSAAELRAQVESLTDTEAPAPPVSPSTPLSERWLAPAIGVVLFFAGLVIGLPIVNAVSLDRNSGYLGLSALVFGVATAAGVFAGQRIRQRRSSPAPSADESWRGWLTVLGWLAFVLAVPVVGFALYFLLGLFGERGHWNPTPSEALLVPLAWMGSLLLPAAGVLLWRSSRQAGAMSSTKPAVRFSWPRMAAGLGVAAIVMFVLVAALFFAVSQAYLARRAIAAEKVARARAALEMARDRQQAVRRNYVATGNDEAALTDPQTAGIGVALAREDGQIVVGAILPNAPAARDGRLKAGDRILGVEEEGQEYVSVDGLDLAAAAKLLRGQEGSRVTLHVVLQGKTADERIRIALTRGRLPLFEAGARGQWATNSHAPAVR